MSGDQTLLFNLTDKVQYFLGAADREGRNNHVAAPVEHTLNAHCKLAYIVNPFCRVQAISIGRFNHQILRLCDMLGIFQDRLVMIADISAEADLFCHTVLMEPHLDSGRTEQVAHIRQTNGDRLIYLDYLAVRAGPKLFQNSLGIFGGVKRLDLSVAAAFGLSVFPLSFCLLDTGGITEHNLAEGVCGGAGIHRSPETFFIQKRQEARMVNVCMCKQDKIQFGCRDGKRPVDKKIFPLFHAVIHNTLFITCLDQRGAAGNFVCRAVKTNLHKNTPL